MNIILLKRKKGSSSLVTLNKKKVATVLMALFVILPATFLFTGYKIGVHYMQANPDDLMVAMQSEMDMQRLKIDVPELCARFSSFLVELLLEFEHFLFGFDLGVLNDWEEQRSELRDRTA